MVSVDGRGGGGMEKSGREKEAAAVAGAAGAAGAVDIVERLMREGFLLSF